MSEIKKEKKKNFGKLFEEDFSNSVNSYGKSYFIQRLQDSASSWNGGRMSRFTINNPFDYLCFNGHKLLCLELKSTKDKNLTIQQVKHIITKEKEKYEKTSGDIKVNQIEGLIKAKDYPNTYGYFIINFREFNKTFALSIENFCNVMEIDSEDYLTNKEKITVKKSINYDQVKKYGLLIPQQVKICRYKYDIETLFEIII